MFLRYHKFYKNYIKSNDPSTKMKRACEFEDAPETQRMRMTRMKRVLDDIEVQGQEKRFRRTVSELDETKRTLRFHQEEVASLRNTIALQAKTIAYQDRRIREGNATLLTGKQAMNALIERIQELESSQNYSAERFERPFWVA
tara:strand:+ start:691 stop:1119 length:429 start_codon:yes stop_codon:yes gene_type:complete